MGAEGWANLGTEGSRGTKLFCLSGHITRPGTYELPFGITVRELLAMAGGVRDGKALKGILLGGAAGSFIGPDLLDMPLTYEDAKANGVSLGSGALMILVLYVPFLQKIFNTVSLGWKEWSLIIPLFLIPSIAAEAVKYIVTARRKKKKTK